MQIIPKHSFELVFSEYWQAVYTDIDRYLVATVNYYLTNALEFNVAIEWKQQHIFSYAVWHTFKWNKLPKEKQNVEQGLDSIHRVLIKEVWGLTNLND